MGIVWLPIPVPVTLVGMAHHANSLTVLGSTCPIHEFVQQMVPVYQIIPVLAIPIGTDPNARSHHVSENWEMRLLPVMPMVIVCLPILVSVTLVGMAHHVNFLIVSGSTCPTHEFVQRMALVHQRIPVLAIPIGMEPNAKLHRVLVYWATQVLSAALMDLV